MGHAYGPFGWVKRRAMPTEVFAIVLLCAIWYGLKPRAVLQKLHKVVSEANVRQIVRSFSREFSQESLFAEERPRNMRQQGEGLRCTRSETNMLAVRERAGQSGRLTHSGVIGRSILSEDKESSDGHRREENINRFVPSGSDSAGWISHLGRWGAFRTDRLFFTLLCTHCASLFVYVLNGKYFFGLKLALLQWAARSVVVRSWLKLVLPVANGAMVLLAYAVSRTHPLRKHVILRWRTLAVINVLLLYALQRLYELIRGDATPILMAESSAEVRDILSFVPPSKGTVSKISSLLSLYLPVTLLHTDRIRRTDRLLFVGNHSLFALDSPSVAAAVYLQTGIFMRSFAEHSWFAMPGLSELLSMICGVVDGTKENCDALMESGANLLVYPGGAKEAWKLTTDQKYSLKWGRKPTGFAKMAIKHKYTIVALSCIGVEDAFRPLVDLPISSILRFGGLIKPNNGSFLFRKDSKIPVLAPPNPMNAQRLYCQFSHPIWTEGPDAVSDPDQLREIVKKELESGIEQLKTYRDHDPKRYVFRSNASSL